MARGTQPRARQRMLPAAALVIVLTAGCAGDSPSTLDPAGYGARRVESLWWLLFWISAAILTWVLLLVVWALLRPRRKEVRRGSALRFVAISGALVPFLVLALVYGVGLRDLAALGERPEPEVTIDVVAHQWWWEVRYPEAGSGAGAAVTANEIHIPVDQPVLVRLETADVLHSFWVPQLMPKTDTIAGTVNETWLRAEQPGRYRGMCAEYCGLQHAQMSLLVVAQPRAEFDAWLADLAAPAPAPQTAAQQRGLEVFEQGTCAACHTVRGTAADGTVGPDLSTVGSRWSLGAGAAPNDRGHLGGWIANSQTIKPGNEMPPQPVGAQDLPDLLAYLETLE